MGKKGPMKPLIRSWRIGGLSGLYMSFVDSMKRRPKLSAGSATSKYSHAALSNAFSLPLSFLHVESLAPASLDVDARV